MVVMSEYLSVSHLIIILLPHGETKERRSVFFLHVTANVAVRWGGGVGGLGDAGPAKTGPSRDHREQINAKKQGGGSRKSSHRILTSPPPSLKART